MPRVETPAHPGTDWADYNVAQSGRPPRRLVLDALQVAAPGEGRTALELGCGIGVEARALADHGWRVHTFDRDASVVPSLEALAKSRPIQHTTRPLEDLTSLPASDLTLACVSLPFVDSNAFAQLWRLILTALRPGGVLAVDLFGERDDWANGPGTFLSRAQVERLLDPLQVLSLEEQDRDGLAFAGPKHWHTFQVIARKPNPG
ncbi:MAG: class I SAM-dependent methyltransferase [Nocardioides sp.]|nr:class I SAM-dependent methyltransferase [Nocardioides sp.]